LAISDTGQRAARRYRVLVVDDDLGALTALEAVLSEHFEVRTIADPRDALALARREYFHVICADLEMPHLRGPELLRATAAVGNTTYGILITGHKDRLTAADHEDRRLFSILSKPYHPENLVKLILQLAGLAEAKRSLPSVRR
jgi:DNA-binding NtrC family response regulator